MKRCRHSNTPALVTESFCLMNDDDDDDDDKVSLMETTECELSTMTTKLRQLVTPPLTSDSSSVFRFIFPLMICLLIKAS